MDIVNHQIAIIPRNANAMGSSSNKNDFNNTTFEGAGFFRYESYDTTITFSKRGFDPEIPRDQSTVLKDVGPRTPRFLDAENIPPKMFGKYFYFAF